MIADTFGSGILVNHGRLEGNSATEPLVIASNLHGDGVLKDVEIVGSGRKQHVLGDIGTTAVVNAEGVYKIVDRVSLLVDLGGTTPGSGYDQLNSTGPIMLTTS